MDTHERRVVEVLTDSKRFVVPIYQRQYAWGDQELSAFWEDVVAKCPSGNTLNRWNHL